MRNGDIMIEGPIYVMSFTHSQWNDVITGINVGPTAGRSAAQN